MTGAAGNLADNFAAVSSRVASACRRAGRDPGEIRLIWVGKNHARERLIQAHGAGARLFGENRVQEVLEKFPLLDGNGAPLDHALHFIGHLQRNKIRKVLPLCAAIHSVDTADLWRDLNRIAGELGLQRDVFLQVNASREAQKSGFPADNFPEAAAALPPAPHLRLIGLMAMGPAEGGPDAARPCFRELRGLLTSLRERSGDGGRFQDLRCLSMGMTSDFEVAVEEGAHYLRIGSALFGK